MRRLFLILPLLASVTAMGQNTNPNNVRVNANAYQGWMYDAGITLGGNVTRNEFVLSGAQNGNTVTVTSNALASINYAQPRYEWRNILALGLGFSHTPALPELVKGDDFIKLTSEFRYKLDGINWIFPYADASWTSNILDATDYRASATTYQNEAGVVLGTGTEHDLSRGLSIHRFEETIGVILVLFNKKAVPEFNLEGRVGIGAKQNAFNGQSILTKFENDVATVEEREYTSKVGVKYGLYANGVVGSKAISYTAYAAFLSPFSQFPEEDGNELSISQATDHELGLNVAFNATSWLSLVYDFKNVRQPDIQKESQITHSFLATTAFAMKGTW